MNTSPPPPSTAGAPDEDSAARSSSGATSREPSAREISTALINRAVVNVEAMFADYLGPTPPVSSRPMTQAERETAAYKPRGLVDTASIEARSLPVKPDCPYCRTPLVSHEMGELVLVCPK